MNQFKGVATVIGANPVAILVVHRGNFQTERPFPSSLPSLVWDVSSGNGGTYCWGAAGSGVGVTTEAAEGRAGLQRGGWSQRAGQGQGGSPWFLGAVLPAAQEISITVAPCLPALSCSGSPLGWSHRGRYVLAPATVSWLHSLLCCQQQPLCALMIHSRVRLFLSLPFPNDCQSLGTLDPGEGLLRPSSLQCIEPMFKLFFKNVMCKVLIRIKAGVLVV